MRDRLLQISTMKGIKFRFNTTFEYIKPCDEGGYFVKMSDCDEEKADLVLFAVGRIPNTEGLGLENAGVELGEGGEVKVDRFSKTNVDHIYAVGDVTDRVQLTPVAIREGQAFADSVFGEGDPVAVDHSCIPSAVFSHPPIAAVGLTEGEAKNQLGSVKVYLSDFRPMKNVLAGRNERSLIKMICDGDSGRIVGIHMIAPEAPEMMQAGRDRGEGGADQGRLRRDHRDPPDHGGGTGADALGRAFRAFGLDQQHPVFAFARGGRDEGLDALGFVRCGSGRSRRSAGRTMTACACPLPARQGRG